ncbi:MAG: UDP-N-acetylglucosamine--N-acetylmuramyl-(pentapeptide) pyrophosphoryl-undecaprenol N-acetylglucosamine transferase, partial [bacterium]|nr:UDP-N-acetylglucosamine--N-acetylmuramyl-(pentapeptide) pyrophosphoryl-undecaprenol N-acetylglucosamine transferase [bacterium]
MKKLLVTGGHATPALAVIEELQKKEGWEINWVGEEKAVTGTSVKTLEYTTLPSLGIPFYPLITLKLHRGKLVENILSLWKFPVGFAQSFLLLLRLRPDVVLSFGSYISFPICFLSKLLGIPVVIHEQTAASGLANRIVGLFADRVAISFQDSSVYFPKEKTVLTGNPIRKVFFEIASERKRKKPVKHPYLIVFCGSRGSIAVNNAVLSALPGILLKCNVMHITGALDHKRVIEERQKLPTPLRARYQVIESLSIHEVPGALGVADFALARAGANTVTEFAAVGLPAIFVPLPHAGSNEQQKNAETLSHKGAAIIIKQEKLTKDKLLKAIDSVLKN